MVDQNVWIEAMDTSYDYYFPHCQVYNDLDKSLTELPIPMGEISIDMLFATEIFRVVGKWRNDVGVNEYDGLTAFQRWIRFKTYNKTQGIVYAFHWGESGFEEPTVYVKFMAGRINRESGYKGDLQYNITFRVVTVAAGI